MQHIAYYLQHIILCYDKEYEFHLKEIAYNVLNTRSRDAMLSYVGTLSDRQMMLLQDGNALFDLASKASEIDVETLIEKLRSMRVSSLLMRIQNKRGNTRFN